VSPLLVGKNSPTGMLQQMFIFQVQSRQLMTAHKNKGCVSAVHQQQRAIAGFPP
jgi:hypothetical protein